MIDPQLQGIKWIKNKYGEDLIVLRLTEKNYLDKIEHAIANGEVVLLESIMETVDAVLDPILGRVLIKKGRLVYILFFVKGQLDQIDLIKLMLTKGHQGGRQRGGLRPALPSDLTNKTGESSL